MACYDLTSPAVLEQPAYTRLRERRSNRETAVMSRIPLLVRRIYRSLGEPRVSDEPVPRDAPFVLAVAMTPPEEKVDDFNAWYAEEHMPMLLKVPGWLRIRRFELLDGQGPRYLALHELANLDVFQIPDYKASISTPWRGRIHEYILEWERAIYELFRTFPRPHWEGSRS
ncbi:MAG: hypothetical protein HY329_09145 [Chloroflexi bacterium]|nr:hypothetical protein [Chloroflexota bacterium]